MLITGKWAKTTSAADGSSDVAGEAVAPAADADAADADADATAINITSNGRARSSCSSSSCCSYSGIVQESVSGIGYNQDEHQYNSNYHNLHHLHHHHHHQQQQQQQQQQQHTRKECSRTGTVNSSSNSSMETSSKPSTETKGSSIQARESSTETISTGIGIFTTGSCCTYQREDLVQMYDDDREDEKSSEEALHFDDEVKLSNIVFGSVLAGDVGVDVGLGIDKGTGTIAGTLKGQDTIICSFDETSGTKDGSNDRSFLVSMTILLRDLPIRLPAIPEKIDDQKKRSGVLIDALQGFSDEVDDEELTCWKEYVYQHYKDEIIAAIQLSPLCKSTSTSLSMMSKLSGLGTQGVMIHSTSQETKVEDTKEDTNEEIEEERILLQMYTNQPQQDLPLRHSHSASQLGRMDDSRICSLMTSSSVARCPFLVSRNSNDSESENCIDHCTMVQNDHCAIPHDLRSNFKNGHNTIMNVTNRSVDSSTDAHISSSSISPAIQSSSLCPSRSSPQLGRFFKHQKRLDILNRVAEVQLQYLQAKGPKVVYGALLQGVLDLMDCEYGFIGEVKYETDDVNTMYLHSHSTTTNSWDPRTQKYFEQYAAGLKFYRFDTLFGDAIINKRPILTNDAENDPRRGKRGCPAEHPPLTNFLGVPFFRPNGDVMGMIAIANKLDGFQESDIEFIEPFTATAANLVQAYSQIEANDHLIETLELRVLERTRELQAANDELELANKRVTAASAAQLQHFACMSHEIRTPLNCIIGLSSLLLESAKDSIDAPTNFDSADNLCCVCPVDGCNSNNKLSPSQQESIQMIVTSGDLLLTVVNDVLDYSKLQSGNVDITIERSNLQETLNGVVHSIEMKGIQKSLKIRTLYDTSIPEFVTTDSRRLQQVLYNLLGNALKFSPENTYIDLKVQLIQKDKNETDNVTRTSTKKTISSLTQNQNLVLEMQNTTQQEQEQSPQIQHRVHHSEHDLLNIRDTAAIGVSESVRYQNLPETDTWRGSEERLRPKSLYCPKKLLVEVDPVAEARELVISIQRGNNTAITSAKLKVARERMLSSDKIQLQQSLLSTNQSNSNSFSRIKASRSHSCNELDQLYFTYQEEKKQKQLEGTNQEEKKQKQLEGTSTMIMNPPLSGSDFFHDVDDGSSGYFHSDLDDMDNELVPSAVNTESKMDRRNSNTPEFFNDSDYIIISSPKSETILSLQVKDYGVGIAESDFGRIFEPFSQATPETERVFGGTGLGLAITSRLVQALGGKICVDSEIGKWSEFTVELPFHDELANVEKISQALSKTQLYIVQRNDCTSSCDGTDDETERHCLKKVLKDYNVHTANFFPSMTALTSCFTKPPNNLYQNNNVRAPAKDYSSKEEIVTVCLIHEDQYSRSHVETIRKQLPLNRMLLFTFGPKFSVNEAKFHFRSLTQVLPSVLMETLATAVTTMDSTSSSSSRPARKNEVNKLATTSPKALSLRYSHPCQELRILIAEDNKINQKVLCRMLERMRIKNIDVVDDGRCAVQQEAKKEYDLILMDIQMPIMDGIEATKLIFQSCRTDNNNNNTNDHGTSSMNVIRKHPVPPIIFVTAHAESSYEKECLAAGGSGFLSKPVSVNDVETLIHHIIVHRI